LTALIGIRREDKNEWERRVPLVPADLADLASVHGLQFRVQRSPNRVFRDGEYAEAGADLVDGMPEADVVLAVKEIPTDLLRPETAYVYFSHVIKGQPYNMPMLRQLLSLRDTLIDYEKITDALGRRLIFFSLHAGYAGTIETLRALGRRLAARGYETPLTAVQHAWEYGDLATAKAHLREVGGRLSYEALGGRRRPIILGIAGYGNVAHGCREILDCLPVTEIPAEALAGAAGYAAAESPLLAVTFREEDMVESARGGAFDLREYYAQPELYRGIFDRHLPHLDVLINAVYWDDRYPRLVTADWVRRQYASGEEPRLQVIGDISCDVGGGIEINEKVTLPDEPCYVWEAATGRLLPGVEGEGPVVMAVDNLPCELPREASESFSRVLREFIPALAGCDFGADFVALDLPDPLKRAVICHRGELTPEYRYLQECLDEQSRV